MSIFSLSKRVAGGLKVFAALFIISILVIVIINLSFFDKEPNPELAAGSVALEMPTPEENAYVALWGMRAAEEIDMIEAGLAMITRHSENVENFGRHEFSTEDYEEVLGLASSQGSTSVSHLDANWLGNYEHCMPRARLGCLSELSQEVMKIQDDERFNTILARYEEIVQMPYFTEPYFDSALDHVPGYQLILQTSFLHSALLYGSNSPNFLQQIELDMIFWKNVLEGKNSLIAKMVAVAAIWKNARFASEYMSDHELSSSDIQLIERIVMPLTDDQVNISEAWWYELIPGTLASNNFGWFINLFGQLNATNDLFWIYLWKPIMELSELGPAELNVLVQAADAAGESVLDCCRPDVNEFFSISPASFYNLTGKYAMSTWFTPTWDAADYLGRVHDINGLLSLVQLKLEIITSAEQNIPSMIEQSGLTNPHTGEPLIYDPEQGLIYFECQDTSSLCAVEIK